MKLRGEGHVGAEVPAPSCCSTCGMFNPSCPRCRALARRAAAVEDELTKYATFITASPYRSPPAPTLEQRVASLEFEKALAEGHRSELEHRLRALEAELLRRSLEGPETHPGVVVGLLTLLCLNIGMLVHMLGH